MAQRQQELVVLVTGAAGRISYSLLPLLLSGRVFGQHVNIKLRLFDIPESADRLEGVRMEIMDSYFEYLSDVVASTNPEIVFNGVQVVILLGGFPRLPGMERRDLIMKNAENIIAQARLLNTFGSSKTKVLVVANPANTNCLVAIKHAPKIPSHNFSCLTRLDEQRLKAICSQALQRRINQLPRSIHNVFILGNHSTTQVAHITNGYALMEDNSKLFLSETLEDEKDPLKNEYKHILHTVQNRGAEIIKKMQVSSALSAAEAIGQHLRDWIGDNINNTESVFSMGILSNGNPYGVPDDLVFSFPVVRMKSTTNDEENDMIVIDSSLTINESVRRLITKTVEELLDEKNQISHLL